MLPALRPREANSRTSSMGRRWCSSHITNAPSSNAPAPAQLARRLGITTASATLLVDRLEAAGHALRRRDHPDRRRITVTPTEQARTGVLEAMLPMLAAIGEVAEGRDDRERAVIEAYLADVAEALRDFARER